MFDDMRKIERERGRYLEREPFHITDPSINIYDIKSEICGNLKTSTS